MMWQRVRSSWRTRPLGKPPAPGWRQLVVGALVAFLVLGIAIALVRLPSQVMRAPTADSTLTPTATASQPPLPITANLQSPLLALAITQQPYAYAVFARSTGKVV